MGVAFVGAGSLSGGLWESAFTCFPGSGCSIEWDTVAAIASFFVGLFAWITARRSSRIAERAVEIAAQQHREMEIQRVKAGEVLGHMLVAEIGALPVSLSAVKGLIQRLMLNANTSTYSVMTIDGRLTRQLRLRMAIDEMASSENSIGRIHNLPDGVAHQLARLLGHYRLLQSAAKHVLERCDDENFDSVIYERGMSDWIELDRMAQTVFDVAVDCANAIRQYVGMDAVKYGADGRIVLD